MLILPTRRSSRRAKAGTTVAFSIATTVPSRCDGGEILTDFASKHEIPSRSILSTRRTFVMRGKFGSMHIVTARTRDESGKTRVCLLFPQSIQDSERRQNVEEA